MRSNECVNVDARVNETHRRGCSSTRSAKCRHRTGCCFQATLYWLSMVRQLATHARLPYQPFTHGVSAQSVSRFASLCASLCTCLAFERRAGHVVANDGSVLFRGRERVPFDWLFSTKHSGDSMLVSFMVRPPYNFSWVCLTFDSDWASRRIGG
jgi:hypothetical protein